MEKRIRTAAGIRPLGALDVAFRKGKDRNGIFSAAKLDARNENECGGT